jgi:hypothetical protein
MFCTWIQPRQTVRQPASTAASSNFCLCFLNILSDRIDSYSFCFQFVITHRGGPRKRQDSTASRNLADSWMTGIRIQNILAQTSNRGFQPPSQQLITFWDWRILELIKNSKTFMEPKGSLPWSQDLSLVPVFSKTVFSFLASLGAWVGRETGGRERKRR